MTFRRDRRERKSGARTIAREVEKSDEAVCASKEGGGGCEEQGGGRVVGFCGGGYEGVG